MGDGAKNFGIDVFTMIRMEVITTGARGFRLIIVEARGFRLIIVEARGFRLIIVEGRGFRLLKPISMSWYWSFRTQGTQTEDVTLLFTPGGHSFK